MKKIKNLIILFVILLFITGCEKITKENVLSKIQGCWIRDDNSLYLIFKGDEVLYTGYTDYEYKKIKIYSLNNMYFGSQNWSYEYINENVFIHNDNLYNRIDCSNKNIKYISTTESTITDPLLKYNIIDIEKVLTKNIFYIINEYIEFDDFISIKYYNDNNTSKYFEVDGFNLYFDDEVKIGNEPQNIACKGTYEKKNFKNCIIIK